MDPLQPCTLPPTPYMRSHCTGTPPLTHTHWGPVHSPTLHPSSWTMQRLAIGRLLSYWSTFLYFSLNILYLFTESMRLGDAMIFFLPLNSAHELCKKNKYQKKFNVVYLSNRWVSHLPIQEMSLSSTCATGESLIYLSNRWVSHLPVQQVSLSSTCPTGESLIYLSNRWGCYVPDWCKHGSWEAKIEIFTQDRDTDDFDS